MTIFFCCNKENSVFMKIVIKFFILGTFLPIKISYLRLILKNMLIFNWYLLVLNINQIYFLLSLPSNTWFLMFKTNKILISSCALLMTTVERGKAMIFFQKRFLNEFEIYNLT
jgi:hypothetical protein